MDNSNIYKNFNDLLNSIPLDELKERDRLEKEKNEKDFQRMKEYLKMDKCSLCGYSLDHFTVKKPCFHWLLWRARGIRKKYIGDLLNKKGFHKTEAYLRWLANCDIPYKNINNLVEEKDSQKFIEITIKYKNLEWSFSCCYGDKEGHSNRHTGKYPHYHFQMKINNNVVIKFNDFHVPFNDYDEFSFAVKRGEFDRLKDCYLHGAGMEELLSNLSPDEIIDATRATDDEGNAHYKFDTIVIADEGKSISGDEFAKLVEEKNRTGIPLAKLVEKLDGVSIQTFISPGPGVPKMAKRKKTR